MTEKKKRKELELWRPFEIGERVKGRDGSLGNVLDVSQPDEMTILVEIDGEPSAKIVQNSQLRWAYEPDPTGDPPVPLRKPSPRRLLGRQRKTGT